MEIQVTLLLPWPPIEETQLSEEETNQRSRFN